jgi:hypothetical protein
MLIIYILLLLLYECSANIHMNMNIFSINNLYSNAFDHFNSYHFNSHHFNSYHFNSYQFTSYQQTSSMPFYQKSRSSVHETLVSILPKSYYIMVTSTPYTYLTIEPTVAPYIIPIATYKPSVAPTWRPTSTIATPAPTTSPPTWRPTSTMAPTSSTPDIPSISFTTDLTLSNVQTNFLDSLGQQSVVIATANTMNISIDFVTFVSSSVSKDQKRRDIRILSFNLLATTKTSIPLQGKYSTFISNSNSLFTSLSDTMLAAVSSGSFTNYLITASMALNSTSTATASVTSITISTPIGPTSGPTIGSTSGPTSGPTNNNYYNTFLYVFVSCIAFGMLIYSIETIRIYKKRKGNDKRIGINTENV